MIRIMTGLMIVVFLASGCTKLKTEEEPQAEESSESESIIGQKTQDIGKFDPDADQEVSDSKVEVTNPVTGPLEAYGPMVERISKSHIQHAVRLFHAQHGRYPRDYEEFMSEIIEKNNIELPVLPGGLKYQYDEENHKLVVVKLKEKGNKKDKQAEK